MVATLKTVVVDPESDLGRLLAEADAGPLILERAGARYRVERIERPRVIAPETAEDVWVGYDPAALRKALAESAGSWADVDTEALIDELYRARERGDRFREDL